MMPRLAALSSEEIRPRICSTSGLAEPRTRFCSVRKRVRTLRFWFARVSDCRERFAADLVLAMISFRQILRGVGGRADRRNTKKSILDQVRGPDAIFICAEPFPGPAARPSLPIRAAR